MAENSHIGSSQRVIKPLLPATSFRHVVGYHAVTVCDARSPDEASK